MSGEPASTGGRAREQERGRLLAEQARDGDRRALARLLSEVEDRSRAAEAALRLLYPLAGHAHLVGITGPPGSGKSTLAAALVSEVRRSGRNVAVVAVDPSSPITGGAILGDRVRMQQHAGDEGVFIRSMASRGHAGGLAVSTVAAAALLDACGFGIVLIETVGTGQSEVEVAGVADTTVVVEAPEMGDEVQAIKAGLLEVADIVAVSKADRPGAERAAANLRAMLGAASAGVSVGTPAGATTGTPAGATSGTSAEARGPRPRRPEVHLVSGLTGDGVAGLLAAIHRMAPQASQRAGPGPDPDREVALRRTRVARARAHLEAILAERIWARLEMGPAAAETTALLESVAAHRLDPYSAAERLLEQFGGRPSQEGPSQEG